MKKLLIVAVAAAGSLMFTGCKMCSDPIDVSCEEASHISDKQLNPECISYVAPGIAPTRDIFRPTFRAGSERKSSIGSGLSLDEATSDAIIKFKQEHGCDYIVSVTREIVKRTHPTWRFFATTNYQVTIYGLPIYLDKLIREELPVVKDAASSSTVVTSSQSTQSTQSTQLTRAEIVTIIKEENQKNQLGLLKLSDIDVQIKAKGHTDDKAGMVFPVK